MTGAQFDLHRLVLVPLTPIHVGGGEEARLLPEDYRLRDGHAERVSVRAVLARLPEGERRQWLQQMAAAKPDAMQHALQSLQGKATAAEVLERIPISSESAKAINPKGDGKKGRNQIDAFFRAGGRPCLPGSSVKGALRTAWAAALAGRFGAPSLPPLPKWRALLPNQRARSAAAAMEQLFALAGGQRAQDTDPFRDVTVEDAPLPAGATRIDRVYLWKRNGHAVGAEAEHILDGKLQMHRERLRSVADGGAPPVIEVAIGLRAAAVREKADRLDPDKRPDRDRTPARLAALLAALEAHHAPLWQREVEEKFFAGPPGERLRQALALFAPFRRDGSDPEAALIRLGWASHAEAKSLEPLRRVEEKHDGAPIKFTDMASTRKVIDVEGHPLPFGWALLIRAEAWAAKRPARWLDPPAARAAPASGAARGAAPAGPGAGTVLGQQLRYRRGQKVLVAGEVAKLLEDVTYAMRGTHEVRVDFGDGPEPVKISNIEGPA